MLDSWGLAIPDIFQTGDVAGGIDFGRGLAVGVADNPVVEGQAAALEPLRVGHDPDAHHDHIGLHARAVRQFDARNTRRAIDVGDGHARSHVHTMVDVHRHQHLAERRSDDRSQRNAQRFDGGDVDAARPARGGDLETDEAHADDRHPGGLGQRVPKQQRIVERP